MQRASVLAFALLCLPAAGAADEEATAIARGVDEAFARACNARDLAALGALYADDAIAILPGEPAIGRDRDAIAAMLARSCGPDSPATFQLDGVDARWLAPERILAVAEWTLHVPQADGLPGELKARSSEVLARSEAGWRYLLDHASPAPPAP